jgi:TPR repeat protein
MFLHENDVTKDDIAKNLYEIYYNYYKNYKLALKYKLIYLEVEAIRELKKLEDFNEKKILADKGFFDLQFDIGNVYLEKKDITNAILYFNLAFISKQYNLAAKAAYELGKIYQKKDIKKAIDYYLHASISKQKTISALASLELGQIYFDKGDLFQAIFYLENVIEKKNINALTIKAALKLSEIYIKKREEIKAIHYLKLSAEKGSAESAIKLSEILIKRSEENEAIHYLKIAVDKGSADIAAETALKLSEILIKKKEDNEAILYLKIATEKGTPDNTSIKALEKGTTDKISKVALKLGGIYKENKNFKDAVKYLKIAIELKKDNDEAALLLYKIYINDYRNYRLAWHYKLMIVPTYKKKIEKLEDFCELKNLANKGFFDLQYEVGNKYLNEGNEIEALKYFNKAMDTKQTDLLAKVALKLGEILINQKKEDEAIYYIKLATKEGIDDIQALAFFKLGEINEKKNIDEAIVNYKDVIYSLNYDEKYYDIIVKTALKLGKIYFDKNELMDAKYWLIEGINKGTDDTIVEHASILVEILNKEKKYNDALAYLNRNIDVSKIRILLNKLDNIYKPKL